MITLNLIPENEKREISLLNIYLAIKSLVFLVLFTTIAATSILLSTKIILNYYLIKIVNENHLSGRDVYFSNNEIKKFKTELTKVKRIQKNHTVWLALLFKINELVPNGITITELSFEREKKVRIAGIAKRRQDLLNFEEMLKTSGIFENFTIPFSVLLEKEDIRFHLDMKLIESMPYISTSSL